jgi:uncharacterized protein YdaU (DUF1376 family)
MIHKLEIEELKLANERKLKEQQEAAAKEAVKKKMQEELEAANKARELKELQVKQEYQDWLMSIDYHADTHLIQFDIKTNTYKAYRLVSEFSSVEKEMVI